MAKKDVVYVAFYRAKYGGIDDKIIDLGSGHKGYSHCEVMITPTTMIGAHYLAGGVAKFGYNNIFNNPKWDIVEIQTAKAEFIRQFMEKSIGVKYDKGVVCSFLGIDKCLDESKTWCSKIIAKAFELKDINLMPNELYTALVKQFNGVKYLKTAGSKEDLSKYIELDRYGRIKYYGR